MQENVDALLKCVTQNIGFSQDKPVAACIIYKSLVHWHSFEAERTIVFDRIIQTIGRAIEVKYLTYQTRGSFRPCGSFIHDDFFIFLYMFFWLCRIRRTMTF